jgi:hypothetical protein
MASEPTTVTLTGAGGQIAERAAVRDLGAV